VHYGLAPQVARSFSGDVSINIQGGPAKVRPTYIFAGNIILVTFECIGKIQCFFGKCDNSLDTHLGKRKNLIFNIVRQMAKNH